MRGFASARFTHDRDVHLSAKSEVLHIRRINLGVLGGVLNKGTQRGDEAHVLDVRGSRIE
jgi:hypothetical protein